MKKLKTGINPSPKEAHAQKLISVCGHAMITGDDGFVMLWPADIVGGLDAPSLRVLADELDRRNKPWQDKIDEHFQREAFEDLVKSTLDIHEGFHVYPEGSSYAGQYSDTVMNDYWTLYQAGLDLGLVDKHAK